jgi:PhnB protein
MSHKPPIYHTVLPYITVADPDAAIDWYGKVFGAELSILLQTPDKSLTHAEIKIGDTRFMIGGPFPDLDIVGPDTLAGTAVTLVICVPDVDAVLAGAEIAGAEVQVPAEDQFHGNRTATIKDPFGHRWILSTMLEELSDAEISARFQNMIG